MYLTLEVISPQAASLGSGSRRIVGPEGLTIGRATDNNWVLPDLYISKYHARVIYQDGEFLVEGLGKNPIAVGRVDNVIPARQPQPLREGDRLFIDQYELLVSVVQDEGATVPEMPLPGMATEQISEESLLALDELGPPSWASQPEPAPFDPDATVPEMGTSLPPPMPPPAPSSRRTPSAPPADPARPASAMRESRARIQPAAPSEPRLPPSVPREAAVRTSPSRPPAERGGGTLPPAAVPPVPSRVPGVTAVAPAPRGTGVRPAPPRPAPQPPPQPPAPPPAPPVLSAAPREAATGDGVISPEFAVLLQAAGVAERDWSPELAEELGQVLRMSVESVMEMLRGRAEIKAQFQLPLTRVKFRENNPLKLMPNVESVLHTLLVQRNSAYMSTSQAFEDAITDIRNHQAALLAALRVAFDSLLGTFDPEQLQRDFDAGGRRSLFGGKPPYWDLYAARFAQLAEDPEDTFRRLWGEVFAEAYEQQLDQLRGQS